MENSKNVSLETNDGETSNVKHKAKLFEIKHNRETPKELRVKKNMKKRVVSNQLKKDNTKTNKLLEYDQEPDQELKKVNGNLAKTNTKLVKLDENTQENNASIKRVEERVENNASNLDVIENEWHERMDVEIRNLETRLSEEIENIIEDKVNKALANQSNQPNDVANPVEHHVPTISPLRKPVENSPPLGPSSLSGTSRNGSSQSSTAFPVMGNQPIGTSLSAGPCSSGPPPGTQIAGASSSGPTLSSSVLPVVRNQPLGTSLLAGACSSVLPPGTQIARACSSGPSQSSSVLPCLGSSTREERYMSEKSRLGQYRVFYGVSLCWHCISEQNFQALSLPL